MHVIPIAFLFCAHKMQARELRDHQYDIIVKDVVLSSTATPTFLPAHTFKFRKKNSSFVEGLGNFCSLVGFHIVSLLHVVQARACMHKNKRIKRQIKLHIVRLLGLALLAI